MEELKNGQAPEKKGPCAGKHGCGHHGHGEGHHGHGPKCKHAHKNRNVIKMIRKCGHYLHHEAGSMADKPVLTAALTPEEQKILCVLLNKLYNSWVPEEEQAAKPKTAPGTPVKAAGAAPAAKAPAEEKTAE